jgi:hypothetical protein
VKAKVIVVAAAVALAVVPLPASTIERWYSRGIYPRVQTLLTTASNLIPVALLDLAAALLIIVAILRLRRIAGWRPRFWWAAGRLIVTAAVVYILFVALWGELPARRLEGKVAFDTSRVTKAALVALSNDAIARVNRGARGGARRRRIRCRSNGPSTKSCSRWARRGAHASVFQSVPYCLPISGGRRSTE